MELQNVVHCWEMEKLRTTESENEIQKLTQAYQNDVEVLQKQDNCQKNFNLSFYIYIYQMVSFRDLDLPLPL